jgi:hypothetical protein
LGAAVSFAASSASTTLATASSTFPPLPAGGGVAVLGFTHYNATAGAGGPFVTLVGAERIVYNSATQTSNQYQYELCNTGVGNECRHSPGGLLWLQTFAGGNPRSNPIFFLQSASSATTVQGDGKILAIHLEPIADRIEIF